MLKKFNTSRYKELRKVNPNSFSNEIFLEFLGYEGQIVSQTSYNRKEKYFSLIKNYLSGIITLYEFQSQFFKMQRQDSEQAGLILEDFQVLEEFILADNLENFSDLMVEIETLCSECYDIVDDESGKPMTERQFYSLVNTCYFQFQKIFPFISSTKLPYEKLISRSFNMLASIVVSEIMLVLAYLFIEN